MKILQSASANGFDKDHLTKFIFLGKKEEVEDDSVEVIEVDGAPTFEGIKRLMNTLSMEMKKEIKEDAGMFWSTVTNKETFDELSEEKKKEIHEKLVKMNSPEAPGLEKFQHLIDQLTKEQKFDLGEDFVNVFKDEESFENNIKENRLSDEDIKKLYIFIEGLVLDKKGAKTKNRKMANTRTAVLVALGLTVGAIGAHLLGGKTSSSLTKEKNETHQGIIKPFEIPSYVKTDAALMRFIANSEEESFVIKLDGGCEKIIGRDGKTLGGDTYVIPF